MTLCGLPHPVKFYEQWNIVHARWIKNTKLLLSTSRGALSRGNAHDSPITLQENLLTVIRPNLCKGYWNPLISSSFTKLTIDVSNYVVHLRTFSRSHSLRCRSLSDVYLPNVVSHQVQRQHSMTACKLMMTSHLFQICFAKASAKLRRDKNAMPSYFGKMMTSIKRTPITSFLRRLRNIRIDKNSPNIKSKMTSQYRRFHVITTVIQNCSKIF